MDRQKGSSYSLEKDPEQLADRIGRESVEQPLLG